MTPINDGIARNSGINERCLPLEATAFRGALIDYLTGNIPQWAMMERWEILSKKLAALARIEEAAKEMVDEWHRILGPNPTGTLLYREIDALSKAVDPPL